jgi:hypothetical protein
VSATPNPRAVGDVFAYAVSINNTGSGSSSSTLTVILPAQTAYNGAVVDRGPGCSASGQTITCPLDFFPAGMQDTVMVGARVTGTGTLLMSASTQSSPGQSNPADGVASLSLQIGGQVVPVSPVTPLTPPSRSTSSNPTSQATFTITRPKTVNLNVKHPNLTVVVTFSKATLLTLTLLDKHGKKLAGWVRHEGAGRHTLTLLLPAKARHKGRETLRVTKTGNAAAQTVGVTIAA